MTEREYLADRFVQLLCQATQRVPSRCFQLPVAESEDPIYRERVYCYELYHQLSLALAEDPELQRFHLNGEIDKSGHPHPDFRGSLLSRAKPDFVLHHAGDRNWDLAIVEVKSIKNSTGKLVEDVETVAAFVRHANYTRGICLVYGDDGQARLDKLRACAVAICKEQHELLTGILLIHHREHGQMANKIPWQT